MTRTPNRPVAKHIHDQTRTIPRFRRPSSTARPQEGDRDILGHPGIPPINEAVICVLVVEAALAVFCLFVKHTISHVGVAVGWCSGGGSAGKERFDPLIQSPLP